MFERGYLIFLFFLKSLDLKKKEKREKERGIRAFLLDAPFDRLVPQRIELPLILLLEIELQKKKGERKVWCKTNKKEKIKNYSESSRRLTIDIGFHGDIMVIRLYRSHRS